MSVGYLNRPADTALFRSVFDSSPIGMAVSAPDGAWLRVNPVVTALLGYTADEMAALDVAAVTHPEDREEDRRHRAELAEGGADSYQAQVRLVGKDGRVVPCLVAVSLLRGDNGVPERFFAQIVDRSAAVATREALLRSEAQFRAAFDASPLGAVMAGADGVIHRVNPAFEELLGRPAEDLVGHHYVEFTHPDDRSANDRENQRVGERAGSVAAFDKRYVRADGTVIWARVRLTSIPDAGRLLQCEDVTNRRVAEETAAREAQRLRTTIAVQREVTAAATDRVAVLRLMADRALQVLPAGDSAVVLLIEPDGVTLRAAAGTGSLDERTIPALPIEGSLAAPVIAGGVTLRTGDAAADPRGNARFSAVTGTRSLMLAPLPAPDGPLGVLAVASRNPGAFDDADEQQLTLLADALAGALRHADDAAHKQDLLQRATAAVEALESERTAVLAALDRLARSERRFAEVFEHSPVPKIVIGLRGPKRGRIQLANPAFLTMLGYSAEQMAAVQLPVLALAAADAETDPDRPPREAELRRADGTLVTVAVHLLAITDDQGPQSAVVQLLDVTAERQARADLARSEEQFRTAFDGCPIGLLIADEHGRFQRANPAAATLAGLPRGELVGLTHREITDPADLDEATLGRLALLRGAEDVCYEARLRRPDGKTVWTRVTLSLIPGPAGRRWRLVQLQDITAERAAAASREREVQRLRATLAVQRLVTAAAADRDAALRVVAEQAVAVFDAADGSAVELVDGDDLCYEATAGTLAAAAGIRIRIQGSLSGKVLVSDAPAYCPDTADDPRVDRAACERLGIGSMMIAPLHAENHVIGCLKISAGRAHVFDETDEQQLALLADSLSSAMRHADDAERNATLLAERTGALAALEASETRFRLAFENSPLGLTLIGVDGPDRGRYLQVNPAMTAITGYRGAELTRMTYKDLMHPADIPSDDTVREALEAGLSPYRSEMRYRHKDGHIVWVASAGAPVFDDRGRPMYIVSQVEDITAKRAADADLRRQARLLELIPAAVIVRDLDGTIRWWNAGAEALYGWPLGVAQGRKTHRLLATAFPTADGEREIEEHLDRDGYWNGSLEHLTADGRTVSVVSRQVLHRTNAAAEPQILEINTDVTAARAAEKALAESEQRFRAQFTNSAAGQVISNLDGSDVQVNPAFAAMLGRVPEELVRIVITDLVHPDDFAGGRQEIAGLFAGEAAAYTHEGRLRHADGHWVDVSATISLVRDDSGRPKNIIGVVTDISARRAAERARDSAADALGDRAAELEAANQLKLDIIGMLGHEIGNPLQSIRGYAELLCDNPPGLDEARRGRSVDAISRQAARLDEIVREVLAMVSIDAGTINATRQELSLRDEVAKALAAMDLEHIPIAGAEARVLCHPGHLQQILTNLLSNAAKYGGGATAMRLVGDGHGHAGVQVEDAGPGVPEEFRPHLFERLTRADRDQASSVKGTGLGLYIVQGLAHANHGDIHHEPNPRGGSRFVVTLETVPVLTDHG